MIKTSTKRGIVRFKQYGTSLTLEYCVFDNNFEVNSRMKRRLFDFAFERVFIEEIKKELEG